MNPKNAFMTYDEIGRELGLSRQAVQLIEKRALRKLAVSLAKYKNELSDEPGYDKVSAALLPFLVDKQFYEIDDL